MQSANEQNASAFEVRNPHDGPSAATARGVNEAGVASTIMTSKEQALEALLAPTVRGLGCEIWGLEYRPWGRRRATLKLFIDAPGGVTIDDCERVSRQVSALMDIEDPIASAYRLEVSSPGLDRALFRREHYQASIGEQVDVRLTLPVAGRRRVEGRLVGFQGDDIVVRNGEDQYLLPLGHILRTRIVPSLAPRPADGGTQAANRPRQLLKAAAG